MVDSSSRKFPPYLANPPAPIEASETRRYELQLASVRTILALFDSPGYDESNPETVKKVVDLMSEVRVRDPIPNSLLKSS